MLEIQPLPLRSVSADGVAASSHAFAVLSVGLVDISSRFLFLIQMSPGPPLLGHGGDIVVKNTHRVLLVWFLSMPHMLQPCLTELELSLIHI